MTPRERMLAALRLEETDRIPIGLRSIDPYGNLTLVGSFGTKQDESYKPLMDLGRKKLEIWHGWSPKENGNIFLSASKSAKQRKDRYIEGEHEFVRHIVETPKGILSGINERAEYVFQVEGEIVAPPMFNPRYLRILSLNITERLSIWYMNTMDLYIFIAMEELTLSCRCSQRWV